MASLSGGAVGADDHSGGSGAEGSGGEGASADNEGSEGEYVYVSGHRRVSRKHSAPLERPPVSRSSVKDPESNAVPPVLRGHGTKSVLRWVLRNCMMALPRIVGRGGSGLGRGREKSSVAEGVVSDLVRVVWPATVVWATVWWWHAR